MMAKKGSKTFLAFGDVHVPHQNLEAVAIVRRVAQRLRPDLVVCLGDLLDCGQFSTHPPTYGTPESDYLKDLKQANTLLDQMQASCARLVMVEGNHEYRLDRWAAATAEGRAGCL
ncbi:MAG TPA: metallophosphoesterase, partial [Phycisphaerae bacterium]|nr:metallophosphoesterase [Phycisphaerae bacterium]